MINTEYNDMDLGRLMFESVDATMMAQLKAIMSNKVLRVPYKVLRSEHVLKMSFIDVVLFTVVDAIKRLGESEKATIQAEMIQIFQAKEYRVGFTHEISMPDELVKRVEELCAPTTKKAPPAAALECLNCASPVASYKCGKCHAPYCGRPCQQQHWNDGHKKLCISLEARKPTVLAPRAEGATCAICIELLDAAPQRALVCGHSFHSKCMASLSDCPLCRAPQPGDCVYCLEPITANSDYLRVDVYCNHYFHTMCLPSFEFEMFYTQNVAQFTACPIEGCDETQRNHLFSDLKSELEQDILKTLPLEKAGSLLNLFCRVFEEKKWMPEETLIKCEVYLRRVERMASKTTLVRAATAFNRGFLFEKQNQPVVAKAAFKCALALAPNNVNVLNALLVRKWLRIPDMFKLMELRPTDVEHFRTVSDQLEERLQHEFQYCKYAEGNMNSFYESILRRCIDLDPTDGLALARLGKLLFWDYDLTADEGEREVILRAATNYYIKGNTMISPATLLAYLLDKKGDYAGVQQYLILAFEHEEPDAAKSFETIFERNPDKFDLSRFELFGGREFAEFLKDIKEKPAEEALLLKMEWIDKRSVDLDEDLDWIWIPDSENDSWCFWRHYWKLGNSPGLLDTTSELIDIDHTKERARVKALGGEAEANYWTAWRRWRDELPLKQRLNYDFLDESKGLVLTPLASASDLACLD